MSESNDHSVVWSRGATAAVNEENAAGAQHLHENFRDCRSCGVCCFSPSSEFVRVTGVDWTRLEPEAARLAHFIGHRAFMRMREGHCAALTMQRDSAGGMDFFCTIYERRPQVCRDLARGSPQCLGELAAKEGRVAAAVGVDCPSAATL